MRLVTKTALRLAPLALAACLSAASARAETTPWAENEGGRMRVTALPPAQDGTVEALLEIEPKPGWITYWREPGGSGIPPQVSLTGGGAVLSIAYPVPKIIPLGTLTDIGYEGPVALPLTLGKIAGKGELDAFIGVCKDICIPFQARFPLGFAGMTPDPAEVQRIARARAALPGAPDAAFSVRAARLSEGRMEIEANLPDAAADTEAILTGPEGYVFTARGTGDRFGFTLKGLSPTEDPKRHPWRVLLKNGGRAVESEIRVD
jgi:DsbC/DsbD-like thiol-disulfide interchange protein